MAQEHPAAPGRLQDPRLGVGASAAWVRGENSTFTEVQGMQLYDDGCAQTLVSCSLSLDIQ